MSNGALPLTIRLAEVQAYLPLHVDQQAEVSLQMHNLGLHKANLTTGWRCGESSVAAFPPSTSISIMILIYKVDYMTIVVT